MRTTLSAFISLFGYQGVLFCERKWAQCPFILWAIPRAHSFFLRAQAFHLWEVEPFRQKALVAAADRSAEICQDGLGLPPSAAVPVGLTLRAGDDFLTSSGHLPKGWVSEKGMQIGAE